MPVPRALRESPLAAGLTLTVCLAYVYLFWQGQINAWTSSDLHINYAAGIVRRGLLGAIGLWLEQRDVMPALALFKLAFAAVYAMSIYLLQALLKPWRDHDEVLIIVMLSPALLLVSFPDAGNFMRKEALVVLGILLHAYAWRYSPRYERFVAVVLTPWLCLATLIYEVQVFFVGFHVVLAWTKLGARPVVAWLAALPVGIGVSTALIGVSQVDAARICSAWRSPPDCIAIDALAWPWRLAVSLNHYYFASLMRIPLVVGLAAASLLPAMVIAGRSHASLPCTNREQRGLALVALLPCLPLFVVGYDWGRWIHILAFHAVALALVLRNATPPTPLKANHRALLLVGLALYIAAWRLPGAGASLSGIFDENLVNKLAWNVSLWLGAAPE